MTFGRFVLGGNIVVGLVVFLILVIINFIVITKGAGRVAEVAARFALDAMPGKQMAIDADLNAGLINSDTARRLRDELGREADFYGAMDGASKFVHGDAVAGLLIAAINLIGGLLIGVFGGLDLAHAAETFSILSIGDAMVSQIPALLISTASGIVVTRAATGEQLGAALVTQMFGSRQAVALSAGVMALFALVPGMPATPFILLSSTLAYLAYRTKPKRKAVVGEEAPKAVVKPGSAEDVESALAIDILAIEVGYELISAVDPSMGGTLLDRIGSLRRQFAQDMGFIIPPVRLRDNLQLEPGTYRFVLLGTEICSFNCRSQRMLAMKASPTAPDIDGEPTKDPAFGTPALWIAHRDREIAEALGYTVVDNATMIATHLGEMVRLHAPNLLGRVELQHLLDVFTRTTPKLVEDLVPNLLSLGDVLKVMRNLLREGVSIRDLRTILESLTEIAPATKDTEQLTEITRQRLARQLTASFKGPDNAVHALILHPQVEDMFQKSLREIAAGTGGALDPEDTRKLGLALEQAVGREMAAGRNPVLVTRPDLRRYVRAFAERRVPNLAVLSFREIESSTTIRPVETVSLQPA
jgi:flagellar biosynthesis protein FlhA